MKKYSVVEASLRYMPAVADSRMTAAGNNIASIR